MKQEKGDWEEMFLRIPPVGRFFDRASFLFSDVREADVEIAVLVLGNYYFHQERISIKRNGVSCHLCGNQFEASSSRKLEGITEMGTCGGGASFCVLSTTSKLEMASSLATIHCLAPKEEEEEEEDRCGSIFSSGGKISKTNGQKIIIRETLALLSFTGDRPLSRFCLQVTSPSMTRRLFPLLQNWQQ